MTTEQVERLVTAFEDYVKLERERFEKAFPPRKERRDAELIRSDDSTAERARNFSDRPTPEWLEETQAATGPSRFAQRLKENETGSQAPPTPRIRAITTAQGHGDKTKTS